MFDQGNGPPLIVIPGIQGRWEWLRPTLCELQQHFRTISYTLAGDFGAEMEYDPELGFENYMRQLDGIFDRTGIERATLCGISYGGFIAVRYAATRPDRVASLVVASAPGPGWVPTEQQQRYVRRPWRSMPAFVVTAPFRIFPEIVAAHATWAGRLRFTISHVARVIASPMIPSVMAGRVRLQQTIDFSDDCARVKAPTLVVTGEQSLDRIVPVSTTRRYASLIAGARYVMMERTGHLGVVTRPGTFAALVANFINEPHAAHH